MVLTTPTLELASPPPRVPGRMATLRHAAMTTAQARILTVSVIRVAPHTLPRTRLGSTMGTQPAFAMSEHSCTRRIFYSVTPITALDAQWTKTALTAPPNRYGSSCSAARSFAHCKRCSSFVTDGDEILKLGRSSRSCLLRTLARRPPNWLVHLISAEWTFKEKIS
jgi:hypothetical protein